MMKTLKRCALSKWEKILVIFRHHFQLKIWVSDQPCSKVPKVFEKEHLEKHIVRETQQLATLVPLALSSFCIGTCRSLVPYRMHLNWVPSPWMRKALRRAEQEEECNNAEQGTECFSHVLLGRWQWNFYNMPGYCKRRKTDTCKDGGMNGFGWVNI